MATAIDLANRSLKLILVEASDSPLEPDEYQDYYSALNNFMADLEARGIRLGYTPVTGPADEVTIPPGAIRGVVANMAIEISPDYAATVSPPLVSQAREGMRALRRLGQAVMETSYPLTLPFGTGNDDYPESFGTHYGIEPSGVAWFTGNTIATDIKTVSTPVRVRGTWLSDGFEALSLSSAGRITNPTGNTWTLRVTANYTATVSGPAVDAVFILMRNNAEQVASQSLSVSFARTDGLIDASVMLQPGDFLELWVENTTDNTDIVVADARLKVE